MKQKIAIYLPLFSLLSLWYIELSAVLLSILITGNIMRVFNNLKAKHFLFLFSFIIIELIILYIIGYNPRKNIEQIGLITITILSYRFYFLYVIKKNLTLFTKCYINMSVILVTYSIIAYLFNITISGRLEGWSGEPGDISLLLLPAIVYYLYHKELSIRSIITIIAFILANSTASFTALFTIISIFLIIYYKKQFIKLAISIFLIFASISYFSNYLNNEKHNNKNDAIIKFKETWEVIKSDNINFDELESLNASSYAFLANLKVALLAPSRIVGTGLGTHAYNYEKVYPHKLTNYRLYGLNANDAYSLSIRIFSELGIIGIIIFILFLYKKFNSKSLYSFMALSYIINACITGGHYTANGCILFFVFFYFAKKYDIDKYILYKKENTL